MSRKIWVEVTCNGCGCAEHFLHPVTNEQLVESGYLVEGRKHFCDDTCKQRLKDGLTRDTEIRLEYE